MRLRLVLLALSTAFLVPSAGAATPALDVLIAMDTTGSMGESIRQAQRDASRLVRVVKRAAPQARFSVVQFKDRGDSPEYELMQAMTPRAALVSKALARMSAAGGGDNPEALNVIFRNSWADTRIGWRKASRKVVVIISDAEPHGAATSKIGGCLDASRDPHRLNVAAELRGMRTAKRTLVMVRQASTATVSLQCYQSLAARAYTGGVARDGGADLVGAIESSIARVVKTAPRTSPPPPPAPPPAPPQPGPPPPSTGGDRTPPRVTALASRGTRGATVQLLYRVTDGSGRSSERVFLYDGVRLLSRSGWAPFGPATGQLFSFDLPASRLAGTFRFCVQARDPSGNVSARSCANVTIS